MSVRSRVRAWLYIDDDINLPSSPSHRKSVSLTLDYNLAGKAVTVGT